MRKELLNYVAISNEFARCAEINLSCIEWKLLLYMISRIMKHEVLFLQEKIRLQESCEIMGISTVGVAKKAAESLANKTTIIKDKTYKLFELLEVDNRTIKYKFSSEMRPHLLGLKDNMILFRLGRIYETKSKYTIRLYLFGLSFRFMTYYNCDGKDFKRIFGYALPKSELERRVLLPALEDVNKTTDIFLHVKYKDGRYYFAAAEKTKKQKAKYGVNNWQEQIEEMRDYNEISDELFAELDFNKL